MGMPAEICRQGEVESYLSLGGNLADSDRALLQMLRHFVENIVRRFVGHNVTQPATDYVEYYPKRNLAVPEETGFVQLIGGKVAFETTSPAGDILQLDNIFVRSITTVHEDTNAYADFGGSDFAAATLLTSAVDYFLDISESNLSDSGELVRINRSWSSRRRTIKVTYNAGFTSEELDTTYSDIKFAVIDEIASRFKVAKSKAGADGTGVGLLKSQTIAGEFSEVFDTESLREITGSELATTSMRRLQPYRKLGL